MNRKLFPSPRSLYLLLFLPLLLSSCAVPGRSAESAGAASEPELAEETPETGVEWFRENLIGEVKNGKLFGYAKSPGSTIDWAFENASHQAHSNLKIWVDEQVERARRQ